MSQNKGKGGKKKRRGKNDTNIFSRHLILKDSDDQEYAQVNKLLGNARIEAKCYSKIKTNKDSKKVVNNEEDNSQFKLKTRICLIRGKMRKRVWINANDIVLISLREFDDDKGDVIHKYDDNEVKRLIKMGELPNIVTIHTESDNKKKQDNNVEIVSNNLISFENDDSDEDIEYI